MLLASEVSSMKPTPEQTRNAVLSSVPFPESLLTLKSETVATVHPTSAHPIAVDPSSAYGCVDWYIYPDSEVKSVAA
jgi:hypothetical protein